MEVAQNDKTDHNSNSTNSSNINCFDVDQLRAHLLRVWTEETTQEMMGYRIWEQRKELERERQEGGGTVEYDFSHSVPGTKLNTSESVREFREWSECVSNRGKWEYDDTPRYLPWSPHKLPYGDCDRNFILNSTLGEFEQPHVAFNLADNIAYDPNANESSWNVRKPLKFRWKISRECGNPQDWQEFHPEAFCKTFGGGKQLFLVGDSLNMEMTHVLRDEMDRTFVSQDSSGTVFFSGSGALGDVPIYNKNRRVHVYRSESATWVQGLLNEGVYAFEVDPSFCPGFKFSFLRNDKLNIDLEANTTTMKFKYDRVPFHLSREYQEADVIIANTGSHWHDYDSDLEFIETLDNFFKHAREAHPEKLIIFRSTPPGHSQDCPYSDGPLEERQDPAGLPFSYGEFFHRNMVAKRLVEKYGGLFMDVDQMTALRPDGHLGYRDPEHTWLDCLHYCSPGPLNEWLNLLSSILSKII